MFTKKEKGIIMDCQYTFNINGKEIPYYHFLYDENLHVLLRRKNYWKARSGKLPDGSTLLEFLAKETHRQFDFHNSNFPVFNRAVMLIIHYFRDNRIHDLDNFVYKPIIDNIRKTRIIKDDDYQSLSLFLVGQKDIKDCIEVFVIPYAYFLDFAKQNFYKLTDYYTSEREFKTINEIEKENERQKESDIHELAFFE